MDHFWAYLHHIYFDPISESERVNAGLLLLALFLPLFVIGAGIWRWFWDRYNDE